MNGQTERHSYILCILARGKRCTCSQNEPGRISEHVQIHTRLMVYIPANTIDEIFYHTVFLSEWR